MGGTVRSRMVGVAVVVVVALALPGCSVLTGDEETTTSGTDGTRAPLAATEQVTIGKREVATRCAGDKGDPSVLLLSGYDTALAESWDGTQPGIAEFARVCAYDRLGVGASDTAPRRQTFDDMADDLDAVIDALELERPVVLVAHSLGGVVAATWAEAHREDLAGLVFVDATPPSYVAAALDLLPADDGAKGAELRAGLASLLEPGSNAERLAGGSAFRRGAVFSPVGSQPVVALTHSVSEYGDVRRRDAARLDSAWLGGQQAWAALSRTGRVQIVDQAGHFIQNDQPQAVVDTVREVVQDAGAS